MTTTAEALDLERWVTFTDDPEGEPCYGTPCTSEPVAVAVLEVSCDHIPSRMPLCAFHRDEVADAAADGPMACVYCFLPAVLARMETIR